MALGRRLLDRALSVFETSLDELPRERLGEYLQRHHYAELDHLLEQIARGNRLPAITAQQLLGEISDGQTQASGDASPVAIRGRYFFLKCRTCEAR